MSDPTARLKIKKLEARVLALEQGHTNLAEKERSAVSHPQVPFRGLKWQGLKPVGGSLRF